MRWFFPAVVILFFALSSSGWAAKNPDGVAVIIGNKVYKGDIPTVDYAHNDADAIKRYVLDILGYDPENVIDLRDASKAEMEAAFGNKDNPKGRLWQYLDPQGGSDIIVYYSGHGVPGQNDKRSYLLPADADPAFAEINGYPIDVLYRNLDKLKARSKTVLIDACFSGASPKGMLIKAASPVFIKPLTSSVGPGMTVLTAASGDQLASWDKEAKHGLFTNHFLDAVYGKADGNNDGNITAEEIKGYLDDKMSRAARRIYRRIQEATLMGNADIIMNSYPKGRPPVRPSMNSQQASLTPPQYDLRNESDPESAPGVTPQNKSLKRLAFAVEFIGNSAEERGVAKNIADVVSTNLERLDFFRPTNKARTVQTANVIPDFKIWRTNNARYLISLLAKKLADGRLRIEYRVWDVDVEKQMVGAAHNTVPDNWRRVAHIMADAINRRITGDGGYFDTRIVYVAESGSIESPVSRLAIMDQDGKNHVYLTDGSYAVLNPKFSPTLQKIVYSNNYGGRYNAYFFDINTGRQSRLGTFQGESFSPEFSPDGKKVVLSVIANGNHDIHVMDLRTGGSIQLTSHSATDTAPSFSPNSQRVAFTSDRTGSQQLYVMDANGNNKNLISRGPGRYKTPAWSPGGDQIVFSKYINGNSFIGTMRPDGSDERMLISGQKPLNPTWAPNGRAIMFSRRALGSAGGRYQLFVYNLASGIERQLSTLVGAIQADWSPPIP